MADAVTNPGPVSLVLVTPYFPAHGGGIEAVAGHLARGLCAGGQVRIDWFASRTDPAPQIEGVRAHPVGCWNGLEKPLEAPIPVWTPTAIPALWRAIGAADAVHVHDTLYCGNILAGWIALMRRKPLIVTQHVGAVPYRNPVLRGLVSVANRLITTRLLARATHVAFISAAVRDYFERRMPPRETHLIPNGVDTGLFRPPDTAERRAARERLGLRADQWVFLFVGRFVRKKGLPLLGELAGRLPDTRWLFAGRGACDPAAWNLPNVTVYRDRRGESLRELYWASDLLLLPSETEGFPLVVQEALACGLPAMVTREIIDGYPLCGEVLLHETLGPGAADRWLAGLETYMNQNHAGAPVRTELAQFARTHWSWDGATRAYLNILRQSLQAGSTHHGIH